MATDPDAWYDEDLGEIIHEEGGQGLVEYSIIIVLIAVVVILAVALVGHTTNNLYSNVANGLNT